VTGPIVPARQQATDPAEHQPPEPWLRFYVLMVRADGSRTNRTLTGVTEAELAWVGRAVVAEISRRAPGRGRA